MEQKNYYAIIPSDVRYDNDLSANAKLLYGEITALSNQDGYCWATNKYFANLYNVHDKTISRWIAQLNKKGYIRLKMIFSKDSKEIDSRRIYINVPSNKNATTYEQKCDGGSNKNVATPSNKNVTDNNTYINNTINNNIYRSNGSNVREDFEKLWELYPNKKGKEKAYKAYIKAIENGTSNKQIQTGIISYKNEIEFKRTEEKFIKHGSTWFGNQCWLDTYAQPPKIKQAITNEVTQEEELTDEEIAELMRGLD